MISSFTITNPAEVSVEWCATTPWLAVPRTIGFCPGLNLVIGPNGSGKSTLIRLIAEMTHCYQGGIQKVTNQSSHVVKGKTGAEMVWDSAPIFFCDPSLAVGLIGGMAGFDDDFMMDGVINVKRQGSHGQTTSMRLIRILELVMAEKRKPGRPTLLLDEGERSLDILGQLNYHRGLALLSRWCQVIAVTHHPVAILNTEDGLIETEDGYSDRAISDIRRMIG